MGNACCNPNTVQAEDGSINNPLVPKEDEMIARFIDAGQGHIFDAWKRLGKIEQANLLNECSQFDVTLINDLF